MSIARNQDIQIDITLQEDDLEDGTAGPRINYDDLTGLILIVYQSIEKPLAKYSKVIPGPNPEGFRDIEVLDGSQGEISILFPRSLTKKMVTSEFFLEIQFAEVNPEGEDGKFYTYATNIKLDTIIESVGKGLTIPV